MQFKINKHASKQDYPNNGNVKVENIYIVNIIFNRETPIFAQK